MTAEALAKPTQPRLRVSRRIRDGRLAANGVKLWTLATVDFRRWWLHTTNPPNLGAWWTARTPRRIPADDPRLVWAWRVDHWFTGGITATLSILLFLAAAGLRWCSLHPARRWVLLLTCAATLALWLA